LLHVWCTVVFINERVILNSFSELHQKGPTPISSTFLPGFSTFEFFLTILMFVNQFVAGIVGIPFARPFDVAQKTQTQASWSKGKMIDERQLNS